MQRHFSADFFERLHLEVGCSHPGLDGAKGMLDRFPALAHLLRVFIKALLNSLKDVLFLPTPDAPFLARGALIFDRATAAHIGSVAAQP